MISRRLATFTMLALCAVMAGGRPAAAQTADLTILSLEDLLSTEITSVSRKEQTLLRTAAAVTVITQEDIRRSGATSVPDLMRLVPGFHVGQLDATTWSVSSRGFAGIYANKLLVLIDGRSIYSQESSGVNWALQLLPLDMVRQVEVIRGSGGSLWGANAVNGVINIITKSADEIQGGRMTVHTGLSNPAAAGFSYGSRLPSGAYNVTRGYYTRRGSPHSFGDDLESASARTRFDWKRGDATTLWFSAEAQKGSHSVTRNQFTLSPPYSVQLRAEEPFHSSSAMFSWTRSLSSRSETNIQTYYMGTVEPSSTSHIGDLDVRQRLALGARHELVAGAGYRLSRNVITNTPEVSVLPAAKLTHVVTAFVQDEIEIVDSVRLIPGLKVERNGDTGVELQPSVRALWTVTPSQTVWAATSRAVRTPNRFDLGLHVPMAMIQPGPLPMVLVVEGNPDFRSEVLNSVESGYRLQHGRVSLDVTAFAGRYSDLSSTMTGTPSIGQELGATVLRIPLILSNGNVASTSGAEITAAWAPLDWWRLQASYAGLRVDLAARDRTLETDDGFTNGAVPSHQWQARTYLDLPWSVGASALYYGMSALPAVNNVGGYHRLDLRVGWAAMSQLEVAAGVKNLLHGDAPEYRDLVLGAPSAPVRLEPYLQLGWRF